MKIDAELKSQIQQQMTDDQIRVIDEERKLENEKSIHRIDQLSYEKELEEAKLKVEGARLKAEEARVEAKIRILKEWTATVGYIVSLMIVCAVMVMIVLDELW